MRKTLFSSAIAALMLLVAPSAVLADPAVVDGSNILGTASAASDVVQHQVVVESYLEQFFANVNPHKLKHAKKLVPKVVEAALKEGLDPLLLAVVVSCESSWKPKSVGGVGEVGLMQVHGEAAHGFDVATIEGNLAAGAAWLASRIAKYGSIERGMKAYMGFNERAQKAAQWRLKLYYTERARQGLPAL